MLGGGSCLEIGLLDIILFVPNPSYLFFLYSGFENAKARLGISRSGLLLDMSHGFWRHWNRISAGLAGEGRRCQTSPSTVKDDAESQEGLIETHWSSETDKTSICKEKLCRRSRGRRSLATHAKTLPPTPSPIHRVYRAVGCTKRLTSVNLGQ